MSDWAHFCIQFMEFLIMDPKFVKTHGRKFTSQVSTWGKKCDWKMYDIYIDIIMSNIHWIQDHQYYTIEWLTQPAHTPLTTMSTASVSENNNSVEMNNRAIGTEVASSCNALTLPSWGHQSPWSCDLLTSSLSFLGLASHTLKSHTDVSVNIGLLVAYIWYSLLPSLPPSSPSPFPPSLSPHLTISTSPKSCSEWL